MEIVREETVDGSAAFGVYGVAGESGDFALGLTGYGPTQASAISGGVVIFDDDKNMRLMFALTAHGSPDRTIVSPSPENPTPQGSFEDGHWVSQVRGDTSVLDEVDVTAEFLPDAPSAEADGRPSLRVGMTSSVDGGDVYQAVWVGTVSTSEMEIETDVAMSAIETVEGDGHALGDVDIEEGSPNVQVQDSELLPEPFGVKVMNDASVDVDAEHGLYGFWGLSEFKLACSFGGSRACSRRACTARARASWASSAARRASRTRAPRRAARTPRCTRSRAQSPGRTRSRWTTRSTCTVPACAIARWAPARSWASTSATSRSPTWRCLDACARGVHRLGQS